MNIGVVRLPDTKARSLILIMVMANSPTKLRGGKFIDLLFRTFDNVSNNIIGKNKIYFYGKKKIPYIF